MRTLALEPVPPPVLTVALLAGWGATLVIVWWLPVPLAARVAVAAAALAYGALAARRAWTRMPRRIVLKSDGTGELTDRRGECRRARLASGGSVRRRFAVIRLETPGDGSVRSLLLTPAMVGPDAFRRLCVRLRTSARS